MHSSVLAQRGVQPPTWSYPVIQETVLARSVRLMLTSGAIGASLLAQPTIAQQADDAAIQKVVVTGSAIKRIDGETSVPITVLKMSDLKKQGITTIEQVMSNISASQSSTGTSQAVGASTGGASFADLRGIGANKTLVLLNGRRLANNALDSSAPDLNMIPFAALERVEVLRDGASSLYGSDAVGGVINFITRKDFTGGVASLGADTPKASGGLSRNANVAFGMGDLDADGYNLFGVLDHQTQNSVNGSQRSYNTRFPGGLSSSTSPANYIQGGTTYNPLALSGAGCASAPLLISNGESGCYMTTSPYVDYVPKSERDSGLFKGTFKLPQGHELGVEYLFSRSSVKTQIAPVPYGALAMTSTLADGTANPYYPTTAAPGQITVKWRDTPNGPRTDNNVNTQQRLVTSLQGVVAGWDYQTAISYNENKVIENLTGGYSNGDVITAGVLNGIINPFGDQTAAGTALLESAGKSGVLQTAKGQTESWDLNASREFGDWLGAGRNAALAVGAQAQHQSFTAAANTEYAQQVIASTGIDPNTFNAGSRNVYALFAELNVPITKELDVTLAAREDKYSDFGNTFNPKVSFRYQPTKKVLLRGSYSTGFRAPSLYEINAAQTYTNTTQQSDPVLCTATAKSTCNQQFQALYGGNKDLSPEKSKNATFGLVVEPIDNLTLGADVYFIKLENQIGSLSEDDVFGNATKYGALFHRNAAGELATDGSQCPDPATCGYVDLRTQNLGNLITNGVDLTAAYRYRTPSYGMFNFGMNSTWVHKYEYQNEKGGAWNQNVGTYSGNSPVFRWQNTATANWVLGQWSAGLTGHYKTGYTEDDYDGNAGAHKVPSYFTADTFIGWTQPKGYALTFGIRNLTDRAPPLSYQTTTFQAGYDPRYTDVLGRTYYVRASYSF
jgi:iron complex outermembrane receptor protein